MSVVLHDPVRDMLFTDGAVFPLGLAPGGLDEISPHGTRAVQAAIAGLEALHHPTFEVCTECAHAWPCRSAQLVELATGTPA